MLRTAPITPAPTLVMIKSGKSMRLNSGCQYNTKLDTTLWSKNYYILMCSFEASQGQITRLHWKWMETSSILNLQLRNDVSHYKQISRHSKYLYRNLLAYSKYGNHNFMWVRVKVPWALGKRWCQVMQKKIACDKDSKSYDPESLFEIQNTHHWSFQHKCS